MAESAHPRPNDASRAARVIISLSCGGARAKPSVEDITAARARGRPCQGRSGCRRGRSAVVQLGLLGAARMVLDAGRLTGRVTIAAILALGVVGRAEVVWDCLRVLGRVRGLAVTADAGE